MPTIHGMRILPLRKRLICRFVACYPTEALEAAIPRFQLDMGISRTFAIGEKKTLQLRGEAFNLPNHLNPSTPVATLNSGSFGKIQSDISGTSGLSAGDPRIIQIALKLIF